MQYKTSDSSWRRLEVDFLHDSRETSRHLVQAPASSKVDILELTPAAEAVDQPRSAWMIERKVIRELPVAWVP